MDIGWLLGTAAVIVAGAIIMWDNRWMTKQAERDARDSSARPTDMNAALRERG